MKDGRFTLIVEQKIRVAEKGAQAWQQAVTGTPGRYLAPGPTKRIKVVSREPRPWWFTERMSPGWIQLFAAIGGVIGLAIVLIPAAYTLLMAIGYAFVPAWVMAVFLLYFSLWLLAAACCLFVMGLYVFYATGCFNEEAIETASDEVRSMAGMMVGAGIAAVGLCFIWLVVAILVLWLALAIIGADG
jgi:hypothetical protein